MEKVINAGKINLRVKINEARKEEKDGRRTR
jgi:hypothetical protein